MVPTAAAGETTNIRRRCDFAIQLRNTIVKYTTLTTDDAEEVILDLNLLKNYTRLDLGNAHWKRAGIIDP